MSLKEIQEKLFKSKVFDTSFGYKALDFTSDDAVPKRLRESLFSATFEDNFEIPQPVVVVNSVHNQDASTIIARKQASNALKLKRTLRGENASVEELNETNPFEEDDESWESARECPHDCHHDVCPFQAPSRSSHNSEIFIAPRRVSSPTSLSLVSKISAMSIVEPTGSDQNAFLKITHLFPLHNNSVIVHWNVESNQGVRGFQVKLKYFPSLIFDSKLKFFLD